MIESKGKIRFFIHKTDEDYFEEWHHEFFVDGLISDFEDNWDEERCMSEFIANAGFNSGEIPDHIQEIIKDYAVDDVIEIYSDYTLEGETIEEETISDYWNEDEYDEWIFLSNPKHRKLEDHQVTSYFGYVVKKEIGPNDSKWEMPPDVEHNKPGEFNLIRSKGKYE